MARTVMSKIMSLLYDDISKKLYDNAYAFKDTYNDITVTRSRFFDRSDLSSLMHSELREIANEKNIL